MENKTMKDIESINYRFHQLGRLDRLASEFLPSIQIVDNKGNKTNYMSIGYDELNEIVKVLVGNYNPKQ